MIRLNANCCVLLLSGLVVSAAWAEKSYGPGVTDTEIKIGTAPYSAPVSAYGTIAKAQAAYFLSMGADIKVKGISIGRRLRVAAGLLLRTRVQLSNA